MIGDDHCFRGSVAVFVFCVLFVLFGVSFHLFDRHHNFLFWSARHFFTFTVFL